MSTYQDFLNVVNGLPSGTVFEITVEWCTANGLSVNANLVKSFGHDFAADYARHGCSLNQIGTDNHHSYTKK